jgi:hypothetical protein
MTIRFAAAWGGTTPAIARSLCLGAPLGASNDNPPSPRRLALHAVPSAPAAQLDPALAAALMHFARHGLSAATQARDEALAAHASGDAEASARWLGICHQLDRRMAQAAERRLGA